MAETGDVIQTVEPALLDVDQLATLLNCSPRHVWRLRDGGQLPAPVRLGNCVRWRRFDIERWLADGCPALRKPGGRSSR